MPEDLYISLSELNKLQTTIIVFIDTWVHEKKTPVPLKEIIANMEAQNENKNNVIYSLKVLIKKGYIRRSDAISNKTYFIQLRTVDV